MIQYKKIPMSQTKVEALNTLQKDHEERKFELDQLIHMLENADPDFDMQDVIGCLLILAKRISELADEVHSLSAWRLNGDPRVFHVITKTDD
jgi:hypothetical protein